MSLLLVGASPRTFTDFQPHRHDCWKIILNTAGEGVMTLGESEYSFAPGTVCVLPPRVLHSKRAEGRFRDIYLHTDLPLGFSSPAVFADDSARTLEGVMRVLLSRYLADPRPDDITEALFSAVLSFLKNEQRAEPGDPVVNSVIRAITASYNDPEFQVTSALTATG